MTDGGNGLQIDFSSTTVDALVNRIADAIGVLYEPHRIRRKAEAEAKEIIIKAEAQIASKDIEHRALQRWLAEETKRQINFESVLDRVVPQLSDSAQPEQLDSDWLANYFDKVKTISSDSAQQIWANLLAKETNEPGNFSKRTINVLHTLDAADATLFNNLCRYVWVVGDATPLIFDEQNDIYSKNGLNFTSLQHLESFGLIHFNPSGGFVRKGMHGTFVPTYCGKKLPLNIPNEGNPQLDVGKVRFTQVGRELFSLTNVEGVDGFFELIEERWQSWQHTAADEQSN